MEKTLPAGALILLRFIAETETGHSAPACYGVVYGHNQGKLPKPLTRMTFDEVVADGPRRTRAYGSSAAGAYQFMRDTLDKPQTPADLKGELNLTGQEKFTGELQDRLGYHLLKRRGYKDFVNGRLSVAAFAKNLAKEWASFPVLTDTQGAHRTLTRGQSYYAGDGLNKALIRPEEVEAVLAQVLAAKDQPARPITAPIPADRPVGPSAKTVGILTLVAALLASVVGSIADLACNFLKLWC